MASEVKTQTALHGGIEMLCCTSELEISCLCLSDSRLRYSKSALYRLASWLTCKQLPPRTESADITETSASRSAPEGVPLRTSSYGRARQISKRRQHARGLRHPSACQIRTRISESYAAEAAESASRKVQVGLATAQGQDGT